MFFFFKQKTAYEMRISDWSSDVCSSDLKYGWYPRSLSKIYVHEPRHRRFHITALAGSSPEIPLHRPSLHATSRISAIRKTNMFDGAGQRSLPMGPQSAAEPDRVIRSEEHTSELQSLMRTSYAVFCLKKKTEQTTKKK